MNGIVSTALGDPSPANRETLETIETPCVVVDYRRLCANIACMADMVGNAAALRPHGKTHKSVQIARMQVERGAVGLTTSKSEETKVFLRGGIGSVTGAYPLVDERKVARIMEASRSNGQDMRFIVDSPETVDVLEKVGSDRGISDIPTFIKVDVGLGRCGVDPDSEAALDIAVRVSRSPRLHFQGLLSHAGHAYGASSLKQVHEIAVHERRLLTGFKTKCAGAGLDVPEVSVGATPTVLANDGFEGITEARPGNYVFLDRTQVALGVARLSDVALSVLATIVSLNDRHLIADAGSKTLSSDLGAHGKTAVEGYGWAIPLGDDDDNPGYVVSRLSEEHAFIEHSGRRLPIGSRIRIYPNHACVVANLTGRIALSSNDEVFDWIDIEAQGQVR